MNTLFESKEAFIIALINSSTFTKQLRFNEDIFIALYEESGDFNVYSFLNAYKRTSVKLYSDEETINIFGTIEKFREEISAARQEYKSLDIEKFKNYIEDVSSIRLLTQIALYPEFDTDDACEIALTIYDDLS